MLGYILKRLLWTVPVILGVTIIVFFAIHLSPGDPAEIMLGPMATEANIESLREELGLDQPVFVQYFYWLGQILSGDFGRSISHREDVLTLIVYRFRATLYLGAGALIIAIPLGLLLGIIGAIKHNTWVDKLSMFFPMVGISMPIFWLGLLFILLFSQQLRLFPSSGMYTEGGFMDILHHLFLPALTLGLVPASVIARIMRSSMLEVIYQDYIRTARAKGIHPYRVILNHAVKNSMIPVVTIVGLQIGYVIGGAVVVETVFSWPGVGHLLMQAVLTRDFPLVVGGSIFLATVFIFTNLIVDILYSYIDPRIILD